MKKVWRYWDDNKVAINEAKHHITFSEASTVFADENAILFDDPNHSQEEERFMMLGLSDHAKMLIVCHCYRGMDDVIRIISARKATKNETTQYYKINERLERDGRGGLRGLSRQKLEIGRASCRERV